MSVPETLVLATQMVKNLVKQVQELQKQVDIVKAQGVAAREAALQQLKIQLENEKKEVGRAGLCLRLTQRRRSSQ